LKMIILWRKQVSKLLAYVICLSIHGAPSKVRG
jgi:hypothetical protein